MEPPIKKQKQQNDESDGNVGVSSFANVKAETSDVITKLMDTLDNLESSTPSESRELLVTAASSFLELKSLQRTLLDGTRDTQAALVEQREFRGKEEMKLENLLYRQGLCQQSILACQQVETPQLLKLCCDELDLPMISSEKKTLKEESKMGMTAMSTKRTNILKQFLEADPNDPSQHKTILTKLNDEVQARTDLETELKKCQELRASLKQTLATKRKLLHELPLKLNDMEKASMSLQKFVQRSLTPSTTSRLGSLRRNRLDSARSLPKPLYTLFYQLQSYLDWDGDSNRTDNHTPKPSEEASKTRTTTYQAGPSIELRTSDASDQAVILKLPIPSISSEMTNTGATAMTSVSKKAAMLYFEYDPHMEVVTAYSSNDHDMGTLIMELFPGDKGEFTCLDVEQSKNEADSSTSRKKPYHWCNYLAGLHVVPEEQTAAKLRISTSVVMQTLVRRVRATATLHWLLQALSRKPHPIPVHAAVKLPSAEINSGGNNNIPSKLSSWVEELPPQQQENIAGNGNVETSRSQQRLRLRRTFVATLKRKTSTITVRVVINVTQYPVVPPRWEFGTACKDNDSINSLQDVEGGSTGINANPLYDDRLAALERTVNENVDTLVQPSDETTYDWILTHQLAEILKGWERILLSDSNSA